MEVEDLHLASVSGLTFNLEERSALQSSLILLRESQSQSHVSIWGKILGVHKDYLIAQGFQDDFLNHIKYFYSLDGGVTWARLPEPTADDFLKAEASYKRFMGDPAYLYYPMKNGEPDQKNPLTEEARLACVVQQITKDVVVVPKGAYYRDAQGHIVRNQLFNGLTKQELTLPSSYQHFRKPRATENQQELFETIEKDQPKEQGGQFTVLRSLLWPGYVAYYAAAQNKHGWVYIGTGQKNHDAGFQL